MGKKISEMTLEELQDYALDLEGKNKTLAEEKAAEITKNNELTELNKNLQKRNHDLFMKVEQEGSPEHEDPGKKKEEVQSCEDFAKSLITGGK